MCPYSLLATEFACSAAFMSSINMEITQIVKQDEEELGYTSYHRITVGKAGAHNITYVCKLFNYKKGAICNIQKRSKKELNQHQSMKMHTIGIHN